jgi:hypothetical protein
MEKIGRPSEYNIDDVVIRERSYSVHEFVGHIEKKRITLVGGCGVWGIEQSRCIESILMRIPVPIIYAYQEGDGRIVVADRGAMIIGAVNLFVSGALELDLDRAALHGKRFHDLEVRLQNRIESCPLRFAVIAPMTPMCVVRDILARFA